MEAEKKKKGIWAILLESMNKSGGCCGGTGCCGPSSEANESEKKKTGEKKADK